MRSPSLYKGGNLIFFKFWNNLHRLCGSHPFAREVVFIYQYIHIFFTPLFSLSNSLADNGVATP